MTTHTDLAAQEQAAFEKWARPITATAMENGRYVEVMTSLAWEAWQARAALESQPDAAQGVPEGMALVPVEPTPEMLAAILEPIKWAGGKHANKAMLAATPKPQEQAAQVVAVPGGDRHIATGKDLDWQARIFHEEMDKLNVPRDDGEDFYSLWGRVGRLMEATTPQPASEPVARVNNEGFIVEVGDLPLAPGMKLYATPQPAAKPAQAERVALNDDPLQGAVDWFLQADGEFFCTATVQRTLRIGYNRAKRLCDTAKERAHGITAPAGGEMSK